MRVASRYNAVQSGLTCVRVRGRVRVRLPGQ
jgi:hypothetical protein